MQRNEKVIRFFKLIKARDEEIEAEAEPLAVHVERKRNDLGVAQGNYNHCHRGCLPIQYSHLDGQIAKSVYALERYLVQLQQVYAHRRAMGMAKQHLGDLLGRISAVEHQLVTMRFIAGLRSKDNCDAVGCWALLDVRAAEEVLQRAEEDLRRWLDKLPSLVPYADDLQEIVVSLVCQWSLAKT
jgi:hypothetical protein